MLSGFRRVSRLAAHLQCQLSAAPSHAHDFGIAEIVLGDSVAAWHAAGFKVKDGSVTLGGATVRLTGEGGGLRRIVFDADGNTAPVHRTFTLPGVEASVISRARGPDHAHSHPNTVCALGELVLYAQDIGEFVKALARVGVHTHKGREPRAMGDAHLVATFFFNSGPLDARHTQRTRVLVCGPCDPCAPPAGNPPLWMFGRGEGVGSTELTGWLVVTESMARLAATCAGIGSPKAAQQEGRSIATLRAGRVPELTGTFAFLSDGNDELWPQSWSK